MRVYQFRHLPINDQQTFANKRKLRAYYRASRCVCSEKFRYPSTSLETRISTLYFYLLMGRSRHLRDSASIASTIQTCPPSWIRTNDRSLKRRLLYQLSYGRIRINIPFLKHLSTNCRGRESNPQILSDI